MEIQYHKFWSRYLQRDMEYKTYGTQGHAILAMPSQDGRFYDWENFKMVDTLAPWIEAGRVRLICCDGIDPETWSNPSFDGYMRIRHHENWYNYIMEELIPTVSFWPGEYFMVTGCSLGAFHAANFFFRRPDIFDILVAQSGLYTADYGFPNYHDEVTYRNNPLAFLSDMPSNHEWMDLYRQRRIIVSVGQGRWEDDLIASTRQLDTLLKQKGVPAWFDYWGTDVDHDWCWWRPQLAHFMNNLFPL